MGRTLRDISDQYLIDASKSDTPVNGKGTVDAWCSRALGPLAPSLTITR